MRIHQEISLFNIITTELCNLKQLFGFTTYWKTRAFDQDFIWNLSTEWRQE